MYLQYISMMRTPCLTCLRNWVISFCILLCMSNEHVSFSSLRVILTPIIMKELTTECQAGVIMGQGGGWGQFIFISSVSIYLVHKNSYFAAKTVLLFGDNWNRNIWHIFNESFIFISRRLENKYLNAGQFLWSCWFNEHIKYCLTL